MFDISDISLRKAKKAELNSFYELMFADDRWTDFNAPYIAYKQPTIIEFAANFFRRLTQGKTALIIDYKGQAVGSVSFYWEDENTRWLEVGIAIYKPNQWSKGLGRKALKLWITHLFNSQQIERVGLTTWSGNPRMMACAQALGMTLEARIRKVRFYDGIYHDSIKFGILRSEWFNPKNPVFRA